MENLEQVSKNVDAWWASKGRQSMIVRIMAALEDSKISYILKNDKANAAKRLEGRVDKDLIPFLIQ